MDESKGPFNSAERRLSVLSRHLTSASSQFASATGSKSSYAQVHGAVSRAKATWRSVLRVSGCDLQDVRYDKSDEGIAKITIARPEKRNAFRPLTIQELGMCFSDARDDPQIGVIILTGEGELAFCSGGKYRPHPPCPTSDAFQPWLLPLNLGFFLSPRRSKREGQGRVCGGRSNPPTQRPRPSNTNPSMPQASCCNGCWICSGRRPHSTYGL